MKNLSVLLAVSLTMLSIAVDAAAEVNSVRKEAVAKRAFVSVNNQSINAPINGPINEQSESAKTVKSLTQANLGDLTVVRRQSEKKTRLPINLVEKTQNKKYRVKEQMTSTRSAWFDIYDSRISLDNDRDGDGYYSEFTLTFDADFSEGYADVYAEIYTSLEGGEWVHLFTSEAFTIYSNEESDYYRVSFGLNYDFPTGEYDILIDLFEVGYSGIVATASPETDVDLYALPLEDERYELDSNNTLITYVASELFVDEDHDGFYTQLTLEYDLDTLDAGRSVFAEVSVIDSATQQLSTFTTDNFMLGNQTEFIDIDFSGGYFTSYYDFEIRLVDVFTNEVIAVAAQDFSSLNQLPIESEEYDYLDVAVDVHVSGGGSFGGFSGMLLVSLMLLMRRQSSKKTDEIVLLN